MRERFQYAKVTPDGYLRVYLSTERGYFSVTGAMWNSLAHARRWPDHAHSVGMLHDDILRAFPSLADIVALHLSNLDGVPMHAEANGWYWYEAGEMDKVAKLLRVTVDDLATDEPLTRDEFAAYVNAQRHRWAAEAATVRAKYHL
jgi:hypothetical protein